MNQIANINPETGIHYGVIAVNSLSGDVVGEAEPVYPETCEIDCPKCKLSFEICTCLAGKKVQCPNCKKKWELSEYEFQDLEPEFYEYSLGRSGYETQHFESLCAVFVTESPYFTYCRPCSPCAPNAGDLDSPSEHGTGIKAYCFGYDFFDEYNPCPYICYDVKTRESVMNSELVKRLETESLLARGAKKILHLFESEGTVASVYVDNGGTRRYRAMEYTFDGEGFSEGSGYDTADKWHYMGERYCQLFGHFSDEVFWNIDRGNVSLVEVGPSLYKWVDEEGNFTDDAEIFIYPVMQVTEVEA